MKINISYLFFLYRKYHYYELYHLNKVFGRDLFELASNDTKLDNLKIHISVHPNNQYKTDISEKKIYISISILFNYISKKYI